MTMPTTIAIVAAIAKDNIIGKAGGLPWHIPEDLRHFRTLTMGGALIMGRRTFDSIGKPLPGRLNIIISRQCPNIDGCEVANSPQTAMDIAAASDKNIYVIGGEQIYRLFLPMATTLHLTDLTKVITVTGGDAKFPPIDKQQWQPINSTPLTTTPNATFQTYRRL